MESNGRNRISGEDLVILGLVVSGIGGGVLSSIAAQPPILSAILMALGISSAIYRFLGGVEGSAFTTGTIRLGGTAAVLIAVAIFVNSELAKQSAVTPPPETWTALDNRTGSPIEVTVNGVRITDENPHSMSDRTWQPALDQRGLRLIADTSGDFEVGYVELGELSALRLFNSIDLEKVTVSENLIAGTESVLLKPYPVMLSVGTFDFNNGDHQFTLTSLNSDTIATGFLRNKEATVVVSASGTYLLMVTAVNHEVTYPWARFGIIELSPQLSVE